MPKLSDNFLRIQTAFREIVDDMNDVGSSVATAVHEYPLPELREGPVEPMHPDVRFEHSDVSGPGVVITGYLVLAGTAVMIGLVYFLFSFLADQRAAASPPPLPIEAHGTPLPPEPRLQESPQRDLAGQLKFEDSVLNKYWWVDRDKGVIGMPIERAMDIIATRGIPPQKAPADLNLYPPHTGDRGVGFEGKVAPEPQ